MYLVCTLVGPCDVCMCFCIDISIIVVPITNKAGIVSI